MSVTTWRCPGCGCLAVAFARAHARSCAYGATPPHEVELRLLRIEQKLDDLLDRGREGES